MRACICLRKILYVQLECDIHSDLTDTQASVIPNVTEQISEAGCMLCSNLELRAEEGHAKLTPRASAFALETTWCPCAAPD